ATLSRRSGSSSTRSIGLRGTPLLSMRFSCRVLAAAPRHPRGLLASAGRGISDRKEGLTLNEMHSIVRGRLQPGVSMDRLSGPRPSDAAADAAPRTLRGKALVLWDEKVPGKKRDAIDTDQITPAADCVSESLESLDERWKAGSFRYLMPDFRKRVHSGETFVIAGDRFAIGSSREMSPAGLKGVAEEAGLEMVVVCGNAMGDIFRRNAFNLGLHVVQSPAAAADARDGDVVSSTPRRGG